MQHPKLALVGGRAVLADSLVHPHDTRRRYRDTCPDHYAPHGRNYTVPFNTEASTLRLPARSFANPARGVDFRP
jgi:hypothetical protein